MKNIIAITFPRSGQHLLYWILEKYFSRDLNFTHEPKDLTPAGKFCVCQRGGNGHCDKYPCIDSRTTYQTTHNDRDFPLNNPNLNYIFQYRNVISSLLSLITYEIYIQYHSETEYIDELLTNFLWWKEWIYYFLLSAKGNNFIKISYEDLVEYPLITSKKVIKFIEPNEKIDDSFLKLVIKKLNITYKHNIANYRHFEKHKLLFEVLEKFAEPELKTINIKKVIR